MAFFLLKVMVKTTVFNSLNNEELILAARLQIFGKFGDRGRVLGKKNFVHSRQVDEFDPM